MLTATDIFVYNLIIEIQGEQDMFGDNLKAIRNTKGYTQEELAIKLNVVRQTVSKWEKGLSVPDADMLTKIADVLETNISVLLGDEINKETDKNEVVQQLAKISEQLAIKNRRNKRIWKIVEFTLLGIIIANIILVLLNVVAFNNYTHFKNATVVEESIEETRI